MLDRRPRESEGVSWLFVALWAGTIYATIPITRTVQQFIRDTWGGEAFTYAVIVVIVSATAAALAGLSRRRRPWTAYAWLFAVAAAFALYTWRLWQSPEEAVHFVEYGVLSALIYRALCHRAKDISIYPTAAFIVAMLGTLDEALQWLTPGRFWGLDDIWLNFFAGALVQAAIALGLRPAIIDTPVASRGVVRTCRAGGGAVILVGLSLLNTPARMAAYGPLVPSFGLLESSDKIMAEYGYLYADPEIGVFRSRLPPDALAERDRTGGAAAAEILDQFRTEERYRDFLKLYTPATDPFLHEARVRLFRRDLYRERALEHADEPEEVDFHLTVAFREQQIMERYFPVTLARSSYGLDAATIAELAMHLVNDETYDSAVSRNLITRLGEAEVMALLAAILLGLAAVGFYYRRRDSRDRGT